MRSTRAPAVGVEGDPSLLARILSNLLSNALRYTPAGGEVHVELVLDGNQAVLSVADNGTGIPVEDQAKVFERFYRADKARSRAAGGTGLGLAICQSLVEAHHGTIRFTSQPERGTRFEVRLPMATRADRGTSRRIVSHHSPGVITVTVEPSRLRRRVVFNSGTLAAASLVTDHRGMPSGFRVRGLLRLHRFGWRGRFGDRLDRLRLAGGRRRTRLGLRVDRASDLVGLSRAAAQGGQHPVQRRAALRGFVGHLPRLTRPTFQRLSLGERNTRNRATTWHRFDHLHRLLSRNNRHRSVRFDFHGLRWLDTSRGLPGGYLGRSLGGSLRIGPPRRARVHKLLLRHQRSDRGRNRRFNQFRMQRGCWPRAVGHGPRRIGQGRSIGTRQGRGWHRGRHHVLR